MDFIIYPAVTITVWMLSISWLLPVVVILKFSKTCRDKWFSWYFVKVIGPTFGPVFGRMRKRAFDLLEENLVGRQRSTPLEILEIGIGGGSNLPFYPENSILTALDMNVSFFKYFEENQLKYPQVTYKETIIGIAEDLLKIEKDSFDIVVCTYVLCSVKSVQSALKEAKRVLKPGGKFLFVEHTLYHDHFWKAMLQRLTSPLWHIYCDGCNINRKTDEEIRKAGFSDVVIEKNYPKDLWIYTRPQILGIATK